MEFPKYSSICPREEAKTFFLIKFKTNYTDGYHRYIRPCRLSYDDIIKSFEDNNASFILEGSCFDFNDEVYGSAPDSEIILKAALLGITIDFIEYESRPEDKEYVVKLIDAHTHKTLWKSKKNENT